MLAEHPPSSHSQHRLRSALHRSQSSSAPRSRHSHASGAAARRPATMSTEIDDDLSRAAFLYRTAATASSPIHPPTSYSRPISPSPSHHDESDHRFMPRRKTSSLSGEESCPLSRAKLERVLRNGRVVEGRSRSRETSRRDSDSSATSWPWSDNHSTTPTKRPKSTTSSESSQGPRDYLHPYPSSPPCPTHVRSRSKTDSALPQHHPGCPRRTIYSPCTTLTKSPSRAHPSPRRNNSTSSGTTIFTPPLTADASPVLNNNRQHQHPEAYVDPDDMRLLTPPPTPPLLSSPYMHPHKRREIDVGSVERLDLNITAPGAATTITNTFNARKASETCRRMQGYVSFAAVEGLGMPPNGVDDDENDGYDDDARAEELKRGRNIIGTWARKLFVGISTNNPPVAPGNSNPTTTTVA